MRSNPQAAKLSVNATVLKNSSSVLSLIIGDNVKDTDDDVWQLNLLLKHIVDLICAQKISVPQVAYLNVLIQEYLGLRKTISRN